MPEQTEYDKLLTPAECAALWKVNPKTVTRWAQQGRLTSIRTLGGHRRFRETEVRALMERKPDPLAVPAASIWAPAVTGPAAMARKKLREGGVATVADLTAHSAEDLAALGIRGEALNAVRLALAKKGLALHGEVLGKVALAPRRKLNDAKDPGPQADADRGHEQSR